MYIHSCLMQIGGSTVTAPCIQILKTQFKMNNFQLTVVIRALYQDTYDVNVYLILTLLGLLMWVLLMCVVTIGALHSGTLNIIRHCFCYIIIGIQMN